MASIFDGIVTGEQPKQPSPTERAAEVAKQVVIRAKTAVANFAQELNAGFDAIWNRTDGLSPQQVVTALDTAALEIFQKHAAAYQLLVASAPQLKDFLKLPPAWAQIDYEIVDGAPTGRVTVTEK